MGQTHHACAALGQHRSTQRKVPRGRADEERLTADIIELARQYGRYGYRKIAELLRQAGWTINDKRVERIWQREGLKAPLSSPSAAGSGWPTDRAFGYGQSSAIMTQRICPLRNGRRASRRSCRVNVMSGSAHARRGDAF